ncbi:MAG: hypothetical protein QGG17_08725 [Rhodospirillales bacterium]|jgi:hypothetical protein|nr:hypothetical protein [Rhodospirillales bacterium]
MTRLSGRLLWLFVGAVVAGYLASAPNALAASKAEVKAMIEKTYGVEVLRIDDSKANGLDAFAVKVMNPGGDFNEAFQINTLVVDKRTGKLISQFRHLPDGRAGRAGGGGRDLSENAGPESRRLLRR